MTLRPRDLCLAGALTLIVCAMRPAAAQDGAVLTTIGNDTLCFERYTRHGNIITGSWVVMHPPGVYIHDYRIVVDRDGLPVHYSMVYREPLADTPVGLDSVAIDYARDSITYTFTTRDSAFKRTVALHEAFPFLGQSVVGLDLAMRRLRAAHADSGVVVAHETSNLVTPPRRLNVRFAADSAYVGQRDRVRIAPDGGFIESDDGRLVVRQVPALDVAQLTKHFVDEYAPKVAALRAAAAARKEIPLPAAQLDRFVGKYGQGAVAVTREGEHLTLALPQAKLTLLAMSETGFFVRTPDLVVTFDVDSNGVVKAMTLTQGLRSQRLARDN